MLRTSKQRSVLCASCPEAKVADILGDSVSLLIICKLLEKPRRFTDLELALAGVSSRTITLKLKKLEKEGLMKRRPEHRLTNRIDYFLTNKGRAFKMVVDSMHRYGKKYL